MKSYPWKPSPIQNVTGNFTGQRVVGKSEEGAEISVPHAYYEEWVDDCGNLLNVVMKTTRVTETRNGKVAFADDSSYYHKRERRMRRCGWVRRSEIPEGEFDAVIALRRKRHNENSAKFNSVWMADEQRKATAMGEAMGKAMQVALDNRDKHRAAAQDAVPRDDTPPRRKLVKDE